MGVWRMGILLDRGTLHRSQKGHRAREAQQTASVVTERGRRFDQERASVCRDRGMPLYSVRIQG